MIAEKMKKGFAFLYRQELLKLVILNLLALFYCSVCYGLHYETDDDTAMAAIASGAYLSGCSDIVFCNYIIGKLLKTLYILNGSVNWYSVLMYLVSFCMFLTLTYLINQSKYGHWSRWLFSAAFLLVASPHIYSVFNFTRTANLTALAGFALGLWSISRMKKWGGLMSFFMIIIAGLIRLECLLMMAIFPCLYCLYILLSKIRKREKWGGLCLTYGFIFAVPIVIVIFLNYMSRANRIEYYEFNLQRSYVCDYTIPEYADYPEEYGEISFSENDVKMLKNWSFEDPDVFTLANFSYIKSLTPREYFSSETLLITLKNLWHSVFESSMMTVALLFFILNTAYHGMKKKQLFALAGISYCIIYVYLSGLGRIIPRVTMGLSLGILFAVLYSCRRVRLIPQKRVKWILSVLSCLLIINGNEISSFVSRNITANSKPKTSIMDVMSQNKNNFFLIDTGTFSLLADKNVTMFSTLPRHYYSNLYSLGGWSTRHPVKQEVLTGHDMGNPFRDAVNRCGTYFVDAANMETKAVYIREHYYADFRYAPVWQIDGINFYAGYTGNLHFDTDGAAVSKSVHLKDISVTENKDYYWIHGTLETPCQDFFDQTIIASFKGLQPQFYYGCIIGEGNRLESHANEIEFCFPKGNVDEHSQLTFYLNAEDKKYIIDSTTIHLLKE